MEGVTEFRMGIRETHEILGETQWIQEVGQSTRYVEISYLFKKKVLQ